MFRYGGARMAFCGQVREHILSLILELPFAKDTTGIRSSIPYHVLIRMKIYAQIVTEEISLSKLNYLY